MIDDDPEAQLYADVADLTEKVPKIRSDLDELATKVQTLEFSGFQEQITSLDKKINKLNSALLDSNRIIADYIINSLKKFTLDTIDSIPTPLISKKKMEITKREARDYVIEECATASQAIYSSEKPLDIAVSLYFSMIEEFDKRSSSGEK
jgi:hypothetical protein